MIPSREDIMRTLADNYYYFLRSLPYDNGMSEGRNKFLANLHITIIKECLPKKRNDRRYSTDYVSHRALDLLKKSTWNKEELVYEHMVPKSRYIRDICEKNAKDGALSADFIYNLLIKYFWTACICQLKIQPRSH